MNSTEVNIVSDKSHPNSLQWLIYGTASGLNNFGDFLLRKQSLADLPSDFVLDKIWSYLDDLID